MERLTRDEIIEIIQEAITDAVRHEVARALTERDYELNKTKDEDDTRGLAAYQTRVIETLKPITGTLW